jgi:hypothetical protein
MSETPYLTAAASIGMTQNDITLFIKRLDKVLSDKSKKSAKAVIVETGRKTPTVSHQAVDVLSMGRKTPTNSQVQPLEPHGKKTPTKEVLKGRNTPTHEIIGQKTPTTQMVERKTPTHIAAAFQNVENIQGRKTPTQVVDVQGRKTPTILSNNNTDMKGNKKLTQGTSQLQSTDV